MNPASLKQTKKTCRTAIYARYSSDMQSPDSAKDQIDRIQYRASRGQLHLVKYSPDEYVLNFAPEWIFKDEAATGKVAERKGYSQLIEGIRSDAFDAIIVDDLSRLTRSLGSQIDLLNLLSYKGVELYSVCDGVSSLNPHSKIQILMKGMINEVGNDTHALRTKRGQESRVLKGYSSGDICYGYTSHPTQTRKVGGRETPSHYKISVSAEEARTINLIFDLKLKGMGYAATAKYLNSEKIPSTERGRKITGRQYNWSPSLIRNILMQEKYIGVWRWGKTKQVRNPIEDKIIKQAQAEDQWVEHNEGKNIREDLIIVSLDKWEAVQRIFREDKKTNSFMTIKKKIGASSENLLSGVLFCDTCESQLLQVTANGGGYYGCYTHHRKDKTKCENKRLISKRKVETKIIEVLTTNLTDEAHLKLACDVANKILKDKTCLAPSEIKSLEKQHTALKKEVDNLVWSISQGLLSEHIKIALETKESSLKEIELKIKHLKTLSNDNIFLTPYALKELYKDLPTTLKNDPVRGNLILRKFFPGGLICSSQTPVDVKNANHLNSKWIIKGNLLVAPGGGFSYLGVPSSHGDQ